MRTANVLITLSVTAVAAAAASPALAAPGDLDGSFGSGGFAPPSFARTNDTGLSVGLARLTDGRLVAGATATVDGRPSQRFYLNGHLPGGSLDRFGFGSGTLLRGGEVISSRPASGHAVALQRQLVYSGGQFRWVDKILIGGYVTDERGNVFAVQRYNADGSLDTTFGDQGLATIDIATGPFAAPITDEQALALTVRPDGRIVAVGYASSSAAGGVALAQFTRDGQPDSQFGSGGRVYIQYPDGGAAFSAVALQGDGKIVAGGTSAGGFLLARLNANGSPDDGSAADVTPADRFGSNGRTVIGFPLGGATLHGITLAADGRITAVGEAGSPTYSGIGDVHNIALARVTASGALDTTFGNRAGIGDYNLRTGWRLHQIPDTGFEHAEAVVLDPQGRLLVVGGDGSFPRSRFLVARYQATGDTDASFGDGGVKSVQFPGATGSGATGAVLEPDGELTVAGWVQSTQGIGVGLARFQTG
jgi:uncharacterized delta-60 repeat protein